MNYRSHLAEMNNPEPENPIFFLKPETSLIKPGMPFFYPDFSREVHYETEIVLRISKVGKHIQERFAHTYFSEIGIGIDFTARDLQQNCRKNGLPWEISKAFDGSGPVSRFVPLDSLQNPQNIAFSLKKNGTIVQQGFSSDLIFGFDKIIAYVSTFFTLKMGDLIFTGTPSGVGPVVVGDLLEAFIENKKMLTLKIK